MRRKWDSKDEHYFGIGIYRPKTEENLGTLWRSAEIFGASFIYIIEGKFRKESSDVLKTWSKIPVFQYKTLDAFINTIPYSCKLIGIEMHKTAQPIKEYKHPLRGVYLLGSEDQGLPNILIEKCHDLIYLPGETSLNVAVAGSVVLFDRVNKLIH